MTDALGVIDMINLYNKARSLTALEPHYSRHVSAMTSEALHSKSDIAVELAFRDQQITKLRALLKEIREYLDCPEPGDLTERIDAALKETS